MGECEVKSAKPAHRQTYDMSLLDLQSIEHGYRVGYCVVLGIARRIGGHTRRWISPSCVSYAAMTTRKRTHLRLPAPVVSSELMDEQDRTPRAGRFDMEVDVVGSGDGVNGGRHPADHKESRPRPGVGLICQL